MPRWPKDDEDTATVDVTLHDEDGDEAVLDKDQGGAAVVNDDADADVPDKNVPTKHGTNAARDEAVAKENAPPSDDEPDETDGSDTHLRNSNLPNEDRETFGDSINDTIAPEDADTHNRDWETAEGQAALAAMAEVTADVDPPDIGAFNTITPPRWQQKVDDDLADDDDDTNDTDDDADIPDEDVVEVDGVDVVEE